MPHMLNRERRRREQSGSLSQATLAVAQSCGAELLDGRRMRLKIGCAESSRRTTTSSSELIIERRSLMSAQLEIISEQLCFLSHSTSLRSDRSSEKKNDTQMFARRRRPECSKSSEALRKCWVIGGWDVLQICSLRCLRGVRVSLRWNIEIYSACCVRSSGNA